jgi:hypothetical protein
MSPPCWEGSLTGADVQRRYLWKSFRGKPNTIPGHVENCSASARNPVRLPPGIMFGISPECCSASSRNRVRLRPESAVSQHIDLAGLYDLTKPGKYRVTFSCELPIKFGDATCVKLVSNEITFTVLPKQP